MQDLSLAVAGTSMFSLEIDTFGPQLRGLLLAYAAGIGRPRASDFILPRWVPTVTTVRLARSPCCTPTRACGLRPSVSTPPFLGPEKPDRHAFLPFGAGPRVCIGAQLATSEAVLVLARLLRDNDLVLDDDGPVLPLGAFATRPNRSPTFRLLP